jgi:hypothetical protein
VDIWKSQPRGRDRADCDLSAYCKIIAPPPVKPVDKRWPDVAVTITVAAVKKAL